MKVTINGFISARKHWANNSMEFDFFMCKMDEHGYITVKPHSIEVEIPDDFNIVAGQVSALEKQREKLREEFNCRIAQINEQISKLQCLEFTPAEAARKPTRPSTPSLLAIFSNQRSALPWISTTRQVIRQSSAHAPVTASLDAPTK